MSRAGGGISADIDGLVQENQESRVGRLREKKALRGGAQQQHPPLRRWGQTVDLR